MSKGFLHLQGATGLCLPPHNMPQSNEASTDMHVASCPKKHTPQNTAERDTVGSTGQAMGMWTATPLAAEKTGPEQRCGGCRSTTTVEGGHGEALVRLRGPHAQQQCGQ